MNNLLHWEKAREIISQLPIERNKATQNLVDTTSLVVAEDIYARSCSPPFSNSAVDGFAVFPGFEEHQQLDIVESVFAGSAPKEVNINSSSAIRIMTGAPVQDGVERVIMIEDCCIETHSLFVRERGNPQQHIRKKGEDFSAGDLICPEGTVVSPSTVGLLASAGVSQVNTYSPPSIGLLMTGNETVEIGKRLNPGQIYNSNQASIVSALKQMGIENIECINIIDCQESTIHSLEELTKRHSLVITIGGISVGDRDYILPSLRAIDAEILFSRLRIKPGKPVTFATSQECLICCLPGNPVSALITMFLFLRPYIAENMGYKSFENWQLSHSATDINKKLGRTEFVPGCMKESVFHPASKRGSHLLHALAESTHLALFPAEKTTLSQGDALQILEYTWRLS